MRTAEQILQSKGVQFPASRSPRDYNLVLIAMEEYAEDIRSAKETAQQMVIQVTRERDLAIDSAKAIKAMADAQDKVFHERYEDLKQSRDRLYALLIQNKIEIPQ